MNIEDRIERIKLAMAFEEEQFEWLQTHKWGQSDSRNVALFENWEAAVVAHDRVIVTYQGLLDKLMDRRDEERNRE